MVARPDPRWGESPCAFVMLKPDAQVVTRRRHRRRGAATGSRISRRRSRSCSDRCRRPRPARSRSTCFASVQRPARTGTRHDAFRRAISLAGRRALVTGASSGLGRHFALLLAAHGAHVVAAAHGARRRSTMSWVRNPQRRWRGAARSRSMCATAVSVDAAIARAGHARHRREQRRRGADHTLRWIPTTRRGSRCSIRTCPAPFGSRARRRVRWWRPATAVSSSTSRRSSPFASQAGGRLCDRQSGPRAAHGGACAGARGEAAFASMRSRPAMSRPISTASSCTRPPASRS